MGICGLNVTNSKNYAERGNVTPKQGLPIKKFDIRGLQRGLAPASRRVLLSQMVAPCFNACSLEPALEAKSSLLLDHFSGGGSNVPNPTHSMDCLIASCLIAWWPDYLVSKMGWGNGLFKVQGMSNPMGLIQTPH